MSIVRKDRRGELFYYMHQQVSERIDLVFLFDYRFNCKFSDSKIVARYNFERFSNALPRVRPFDNLRAPIEEGYFPKLDSQVASRSWPGKFDSEFNSIQ